MKITSFGFVDLAESFIKDALSSPPLGGGSWGFQRSVNFSERTGSLQILLTNSSGVAKTKVSIQARQTGTAKDYSIQGWTEIPDENKRTSFVLKESNPYRLEEEIFEIVDRLLAEIPERDQSVTLDRPAPPPPKSTFEPLIPEIQNAPAEPSAESFDSNQAFIDSLLSGDKESPAEAEPAAESAESNQALVDSLLSPDKSDQPPAEEEPASAPATEAPADEAAAPEEAAPKAKATKPKKAAK
jgi:hypothetical protein